MTKKSKLPFEIHADERGSVLPMFALMSTIAIGAVGGAVDFGRAYQQRSKIQNSLDGSITSGLRVYQQTNDWTQATALAQDLFGAQFSNYLVKDPNGVIYDPRDPRNTDPNNANYAPNKIAVEPSKDQPVLQYSFQQTGSQLTGTASMTVTTPFWQLVTGAPLDVAGTSIADLSGDTTGGSSGKMLEVAVMVDLTGSMGSTIGGVSKISSLRSAGADLLNILLPDSGANNSLVRVGIAPFADYVNAGEYASKVTGLAATGGGYSNIANLASTKQSAFYGSYSGSVTGNANGSGHGATPTATTSAGGSGSITTAGSTYSNGYCATPTSTSYTYGNTSNVKKWNNDLTGVKISTSGTVSNTYLMKATSTDDWRNIKKVKTGTSYDYDDDTNSGYFLPMYVPSSWSQMTLMQRTSGGVTANVGASVSREDYSNLPSELLDAAATGGYWRITGYSGGELTYEWKTTGWYVPAYAVPVTTTVSGCESTVAVPSGTTSKLITCVTERSDATYKYTATTPGASYGYVGAFNHGNTAVSNYSSDGKCWVAGRELDPVIPLTNNKATLNSFFTNAKIGGGTPGHLGTAWASYLLSPDWATVWPATSAPVAYTNTSTIKAAILMTDGEYNKQYYGGSSATQALAICKQMRDQGIKVITVGFGFDASVNPPDISNMSDTERLTPSGSTIDARAKDVLAKCASSNSNYYFPYDGDALRTTFQNIGTSLQTQMTESTTVRGARINH